jgi:hypothetical protein
MIKLITHKELVAPITKVACDGGVFDGYGTDYAPLHNLKETNSGEDSNG